MNEALSATDAAPVGQQPALEIAGARKHFTRGNGTKVPAVDGIDLRVEKGELVVLLGPSGCGKTTLLRCVAGLESPDEGSITVNGNVHFDAARRYDTSPEKRELGMIFQSYALWPHMNVFTNVAYPLQLRRLPRAEIRERVTEVLETMGLGELGEQYPGQLSGGQQQRVALARALVSNNGLVLFDEPLSNVDAKVREQLSYEIRRMQAQIGFAAIYVTHNQEEAMELADRIAVLDSGRISQLAPPQEIYDNPANLYVAKFIGATNEVFGRIVAIGADVTVETEAGPVHGILAEPDLKVGDEVSVIVRPEHCILDSSDAPSVVNEWDATWIIMLFMGSKREVVVGVPGWGDTRVQYSSSATFPSESDRLRLRVPVVSARVHRR